MNLKRAGRNRRPSRHVAGCGKDEVPEDASQPRIQEADLSVVDGGQGEGDGGDCLRYLSTSCTEPSWDTYGIQMTVSLVCRVQGSNVIVGVKVQQDAFKAWDVPMLRDVNPGKTVDGVDPVLDGVELFGGNKVALVDEHHIGVRDL